MNILQLGKYYPPYRGGIETVVRALSEELSKTGDRVTVLCANEKTLTKMEKVNQVEVIRLGCLLNLFSQPISPAYPWYLRKLAQKNSILHFHSPNPLVEFISLFIRGRKVVTYHADVVRQRSLLPFYRLLRWMFLKNADAIVVASEAMKQSEGMRGFSPQVIPFGILPLEDSPGEGKIKQTHGSFILFVGRLVSYKGLSFLLEAVKKTGSRLVIVGDGPERDKLETESKNLGIEEDVIFTGSVENCELKSYYKACEFFVLPSITNAEAYGMVLLEAMSCGKASISTRLPTGVSEVNEDGVTGIVVDPGNAEALAIAISRLKGDGEFRKKLEKGALKKFEEKYSARKMAESYREIYDRVLNA